MNSDTRRTLEARAERRASPSTRRCSRIKKEPFDDLGYAKVDLHRAHPAGRGRGHLRRGQDGRRRSIGIAGVMLQRRRRRPILITRLSPEAAAKIQEAYPALDYRARRVHRHRRCRCRSRRGSARSSSRRAARRDIPVAEEAALTAEVHGNEVVRLYDVGVAGLHRTAGASGRAHERACHHRHRRHGGRARQRDRRSGRLPGHRRADERGLRRVASAASSALLSMLNSCASGVSVVNIDNGFGAGYLASMINHIGGTK